MLNRKYTIKTTDTGQHFITDMKGELEVKDKGDIALLLKELETLAALMSEEASKPESLKYFYVIERVMSRAMGLHAANAEKNTRLVMVDIPECLNGIQGSGENIYITSENYGSFLYRDVIEMAMICGFKIEVVED